MQVIIGNVKRQDTTISKFIEIQVQGFAGQQMHRDCVGAECINNDQTKVMVGLVKKRQACITEDDSDLSAALREIGEVAGVAGNAFDGRINFKKSKFLIF